MVKNPSPLCSWVQLLVKKTYCCFKVLFLNANCCWTPWLVHTCWNSVLNFSYNCKMVILTRFYTQCVTINAHLWIWWALLCLSSLGLGKPNWMSSVGPDRNTILIWLIGYRRPQVGIKIGPLRSNLNWTFVGHFFSFLLIGLYPRVEAIGHTLNSCVGLVISNKPRIWWATFGFYTSVCEGFCGPQAHSILFDPNSLKKIKLAP